MRRIAIRVVRIYQMAVSPLLGRHCRFQPTCSQYMIDAIEVKGFFCGVALGLWRIVRCNPFNQGGYDPVK